MEETIISFSRIRAEIPAKFGCLLHGSLIDFFRRCRLGIPSTVHFRKLNYRVPHPRHWIEDLAFVVVVIVEKAFAGFFA